MARLQLSSGVRPQWNWAVELADLQAELARYHAVARRRDRILVSWLAVVIAGSVVVVALSQVLLGTPEQLWRRALAVAVGAVVLEALYILGTTRQFHYQHAPKCRACGGPLTPLSEQLAVVAHLGVIWQRGRLRRGPRRRLKRILELECPQCGAAVVAPAG